MIGLNALHNNTNIKRSITLLLFGVSVLTAFVVIVWLINPYIIERIYNSTKVLISSVYYTFCTFLGIDIDTLPGILDKPITPDSTLVPPIVPSVPVPPITLPSNIDIYNIRMALYSRSLLNRFTYQHYYLNVLNIIRIIVMIAMIIALVVVPIKVLNRNKQPKCSTVNKVSLTYKLYDRMSDPLHKCYSYINQLINALSISRLFRFFFFLILFLSFVYSLLLDFLAFYIYTISYFVSDKISLSNDIYLYATRFLFDLSYAWRFLLLYLPFLYHKLKMLLTKRAINSALRLDSQNKTLVKQMPYIVFIDGQPGTGKTDNMQDMGAYAEEIQRETALNDLLELQTMFPKFPWRSLELMLDDFRRNKIISNWRSIEDIINTLTEDNVILGFNLTDKVYANGLVYNKLKDVLCDYACLYFLYTTEKSMIFSNFSIRSDNRLVSMGNFKFMDFNAYTKTEEDVEYRSHYTANLIRDMVRSGKKFDINNVMNGAFEYGVFVETEADKEYGNKNTNAGQKKDSDMPNSRNDGANIFKMLIRHFGTKRFNSYVKWFFDAQRKDSVNAGLTQISTVLHLINKSEHKNVYPLFDLVEFVHDFMWNRYISGLMLRKVYRADYKLSFYLKDVIMSYIHRCYVRLCNIYGYQTVTLQYEYGNGILDNETHIYRLMTKRAHANKYATDALRDMLRTTSPNPNKGWDDFERFNSVYASEDDYRKQGSRMVKDILEPGWDDDSDDANYGISVDNKSIEKSFKKQLANLLKEEAKKNK